MSPSLRAVLLAALALLAACRTVPPPEPKPAELHVEVRGEGPAIVLLHGLGGSLYTWRHLSDSLAAGHRVILVDLLGHGRSPKPSDGDYSLAGQAALVQGLLRSMELSHVTLVGNSYGGGVALVTTVGDVDSGERRIERLVLLDSVAYDQRLPFYVSILRVPLLGPLVFSFLSPRSAVRMVLEKTFHDDERIADDAVEEYARALREPGGKAALIEVARQMVPEDPEELGRSYARIDVPVLILWGKEDEIIPLAMGRRLQKALPDARLAILPGCGHAPQEECPENVLPLVRSFLD